MIILVENEPKSTETLPDLKESLVNKAKSIVKTEKIRDPVNSQEYISKNVTKLIITSFWFMGIMVGLFVVVAVVRESVVEKMLPLFTLILGGILTLIGQNILGNRGSPQQQPS